MKILSFSWAFSLPCQEIFSQNHFARLDIPDSLIMEAYERAANQAEKYCEYPANLIRIVQRFLFGIEHGLDGTLYIGPTAPDEFWNGGFGQTLSWQGCVLFYKMQQNHMKGEYSGQISQPLSVRMTKSLYADNIHVTINGNSETFKIKEGWINIVLPQASIMKPCRFEIEILKF